MVPREIGFHHFNDHEQMIEGQQGCLLVDDDFLGSHCAFEVLSWQYSLF